MREKCQTITKRKKRIKIEEIFFPENSLTIFSKDERPKVIDLRKCTDLYQILEINFTNNVKDSCYCLEWNFVVKEIIKSCSSKFKKVFWKFHPGKKIWQKSIKRVDQKVPLYLSFSCFCLYLLLLEELKVKVLEEKK